MSIDQLAEAAAAVDKAAPVEIASFMAAGVKPGAGQGRRSDLAPDGVKSGGKVSLNAFAARFADFGGSTSATNLRRYLKVWDRMAERGQAEDRAGLTIDCPAAVPDADLFAKTLAEINAEARQEAALKKAGKAEASDRPPVVEPEITPTDRMARGVSRMLDAVGPIGDGPAASALRRIAENTRSILIGEDVNRSVNHLMDAVVELSMHIRGE